MHFWAGVSAVAGALRRRVWIDMEYFRWHANHYIVFVAPPGIVSKSTTVTIAMDLLRKVPGINFGPDVVTWPALVTAFAQCSESFQYGEDWFEQSALTLESSEFGNLINPADRDMIDLLVTLWDSKQGQFKKITKGSGKDTVVNPWINMIACTTPAWIAGNFPQYVVGGGFTSRCIFVYAEEKEKLIAYPHLEVPPGLSAARLKLTQDLEHISVKLVGPYNLTPNALQWGKEWYANHNAHPPEGLPEEAFGGYLARKQTHIHKLAMVMAAGQRDEMVVTESDLKDANTMVTDLEADMPKVFAKIGRTTESVEAEKFVGWIRRKGEVPYKSAYEFLYLSFPKLRDITSVIEMAIKAGLIEIQSRSDGVWVKAVKK
jgi:hypothetical protein